MRAGARCPLADKLPWKRTDGSHISPGTRASAACCDRSAQTSPARALLFQRVLAQMSYVLSPPPALRGDLGRLQRSLPGARVWNDEGACLIACF